jgi:hypothetical protein
LVEQALGRLREYHDPDDSEIAMNKFAIEAHEKARAYLRKTGIEPSPRRVVEISLQTAIEYGMEALEAVVTAEACEGQERLRAQQQSVSAVAMTKALAEKDAQAAQKRKQQTDALLERRHARTRELEQLVTNEWAKEPSAFPSAANAAEHFTKWITDNGHRPVAYRTVYDWLRKHARRLNIKLK